MKKLLLLGIWDTTPADSWQWMSGEMVNHFKKLTGFRISYLVIRKNSLNRECLLYSDVARLFDYFDRLSYKRKEKFVKKILADFYRQSRIMETFVKKLEKTNFTKLNNDSLAKLLDPWCRILSRTTMQIWFAVLMDIWYFDPKALSGIKSMLARARHRSGQLHERAYRLAWRIYRVAARRLRLQYRHLLNAPPPELGLLLKSARSVIMLKFSERSRLGVYAALGKKTLILSG